MAIKISGTTVIDDSRQLQNIASLDATTIATINANVPQGDITGVTAGSGLTGGGTSGSVTVSHTDTSSQASVNNSGTTVIQDVTLDTYGHVTALGSVTLSASTLGAAASADIQEFTSAGTTTWTKPSNAKWVLIRAIGGGGGGGSGAATGYGFESTASGGAGGSGGAFIEAMVPASLLGSTATVVVGAGGAGGATRTIRWGDGLAGTAGGNTTVSFSNVNNGSLFARGGTGGAAGSYASSFPYPAFQRPVVYPYNQVNLFVSGSTFTQSAFGQRVGATGGDLHGHIGIQGPGAGGDGGRVANYGQQGIQYAYGAEGGRGGSIIRNYTSEVVRGSVGYGGAAGFGGDGGNGASSFSASGNGNNGTAGHGRGAGGGGGSAIYTFGSNQVTGAGGAGATGYVMITTYF